MTEVFLSLFGSLVCKLQSYVASETEIEIFFMIRPSYRIEPSIASYRFYVELILSLQRILFG